MQKYVDVFVPPKYEKLYDQVNFAYSIPVDNDEQVKESLVTSALEYHCCDILTVLGQNDERLLEMNLYQFFKLPRRLLYLIDT